MALILPMFLMLLFGYALNLDVDRIPTLVFDGDRTAASQRLIDQFRGSRFFEIDGFVDNYGEIERSIDRNQALMAVVIPRDYSRRVALVRKPMFRFCWMAATPIRRRLRLAMRNRW